MERKECIMDTRHERVLSEMGQDSRPQAPTDPVCGMTVDPEHIAGTSVHEGKTYYFCSKTCLERFRADPGKYTGPRSTGEAPQHTPAPMASDAVAYTCPMHPEVRQTGPGSCPTCGMALEPVALSTPTTIVEYLGRAAPTLDRLNPTLCGDACHHAVGPRAN